MPKSIQSRYDVKVKVNIQSLIPTSFPLPCLHTFLHAIPTSFTFLMFLFPCFCTFLILISVTVRPKHTYILSSVATTLELTVVVPSMQLESDEGLTTLCTRFWALCGVKFLIFDHMTTDQHRKLYRQGIKTDHPGITKAALFSVATNKQLNAVP